MKLEIRIKWTNLNWKSLIETDTMWGAEAKSERASDSARQS